MPTITNFALSCFCYAMTDLPLLSFSAQLCSFALPPTETGKGFCFPFAQLPPSFLFNFPHPLLWTHLWPKKSAVGSHFYHSSIGEREKERRKMTCRHSPLPFQACSCGFSPPISDMKNESRTSSEQPWWGRMMYQMKAAQIFSRGVWWSGLQTPEGRSCLSMCAWARADILDLQISLGPKMLLLCAEWTVIVLPENRKVLLSYSSVHSWIQKSWKLGEKKNPFEIQETSCIGWFPALSDGPKHTQDAL